MTIQYNYVKLKITFRQYNLLLTCHIQFIFIFLLQDKESVELAIQLEGKRVQNRAIRIKRIDTKTKNNTNKVFDRKPLPFNKQKSFGNQNFQGELMKPKMHKKVLFCFLYFYYILLL